MRKIRKGKKQRERKGEEKKKRKKKGRGMDRGFILGGHENVSNFCFARFARAKESTVLNRKKNLVGLAFAQFWAGVWVQGRCSI